MDSATADKWVQLLRMLPVVVAHNVTVNPDGSSLSGAADVVELIAVLAVHHRIVHNDDGSEATLAAGGWPPAHRRGQVDERY